MAKILIVDDSKTATQALRLALETDPQLLVVGEAATGREALDLCERLDPDLVTMDVHLTDESGFDVTSEIMSRFPRPILIVTGANIAQPGLVYQAMRHGALDVFAKLPAPQSQEYEDQRRRLTRLVRTLASIPILHRTRHGQLSRLSSEERSRDAGGRASRDRFAVPPGTPAPRVVVIGASTGGPPIVAAILERVPPLTRTPIVVAQHISHGFAASFVNWLAQVTSHRVVLADAAMRLQPGVVHVGPDSAGLVFVARDKIAPEKLDPSSNAPCSIDRLFESAAQHVGKGALAILLTGMGRDGAAGLGALARCGASTIAQAPETCTVDSMPRTAVERRAARLVLRPEEIAALLRARLV